LQNVERALLLRAGVAMAGLAPVCGDVNNSSSITTSNALLVLKKSVQQPPPATSPT